AITRHGSGVDGDALTYVVLILTRQTAYAGRSSLESNRLALKYNGPDSFTFTVSDAALTSAAATVSITVTAVNDAPVANAQSVTTDRKSAAEGTLAGAGVGGDALKYVDAKQPGHGTWTGTAPNAS